MIDLGSDDGFAEVVIDGVKLRLDIYAVDDKIRQIAAPLADHPQAEFHAKVANDLLPELGFPTGLSHRMAGQFIVAIGNAVRELEKKDGGGSELPGSSDSTHLTGPNSSFAPTNAV